MKKLIKNFSRFFVISLFFISLCFGMKKEKDPEFNPWKVLPNPENLDNQQDNRQDTPQKTSSNSTDYIQSPLLLSKKAIEPSISSLSLSSPKSPQQTSSNFSTSSTSYSTNTTSFQQKTNYSLIEKINDLFNEENYDKIKEKCAGIENWLDDIPPQSHKLIINEIVSATKKYLFKNLNLKLGADFFYSLPNDSPIKAIMCFLYYLKFCNYLDYRNKIDKLKSIDCLPNCLKQAIESFIENNYLYEIFHAISYWCKEAPGCLSLIQLPDPLHHDFKEELKCNIQSIFDSNILKDTYKNKLRILKYVLENSLEFVESIFEIKIYKLDLSKNNLFSIPETIFFLSNLEELIIHDNQVPVILKKISLLKSIKILDLKNNELQQISDELLNLPNLKEIDFSNNPALAHHGNSIEIIKKLKAKGVIVKY